MSNQAEVAKALPIVLADTYVLYLKTQNYHWNVTGPTFHSLHEMFEAQYAALAAAADEIAERIRALGAYAPGSLEEFSQLATVSSTPVKAGAKEMLKDLIAANKGVCVSLRRAHEITSKAQDVGTTSLLEDRIAEHEKTLWMLEATLANG